MAASSSDASRPLDLLRYERRFWGRGVSYVAGVDEVGRGPLAGPVVAAAVILPVDGCIVGAADSKTLSESLREALEAEIRGRALAVALGAASVREIDEVNILCATARAMGRALGALALSPAHVVVDGRPVRGLTWPHEAIVRGDAIVHSIACASIVAKVGRDRLMRRLAKRYPAYGWERNKGYGTREHLEALRKSGRSPHHRTTFGSAQLTLPLGEEG